MRQVALILVALAAGGCESAPAAARRNRDEGYLLGASDAVKQLYWARQALEAPGGAGPAGRLEYFTWEGGGTAADGRRLAPETMAVPVFVPAPAPAPAPARGP